MAIVYAYAYVARAYAYSPNSFEHHVHSLNVHGNAVMGSN